MSIKSMTGFSRGTGTSLGYSWTWEIKSVNNKGLDIRVRVPGFLDSFDSIIKKQVSEMVSRGSVFVSLSVESEADDSVFIVHEGRLQSLLALAEKYADTPGVAPARLDGLLSVKGIVDQTSRVMSEEDRTAFEKELSDSLKLALTDLCAAREDEGIRMQAVLTDQLKEITDLTAKAGIAAGDRLVAAQTRFNQQVSKLLQADSPVSEERMAQELAIIAVKSDIQEELDRLDSHIKEASKMLASNTPIGRRLDFLCQEFNREANTLCSKSGDSELTRLGIDLKTVIDQFREQVQNIE